MNHKSNQEMNRCEMQP